MTDRELLELAAKAAGLEGEWFDNYDRDTVCSQSLVVGDSEWDPLTDDGDALRLAVKLDFGIEVMFGLDETRVCNGDQVMVAEKHNGDPYAATRRAIVCAAAEIGKAMK